MSEQTPPPLSLAERIDHALQDSMDRCARCKTCDNQVDAVLGVLRAGLRSNAATWAAQQAIDRLIDAGVLRNEALDPGWTLASAALEAVAVHLGLGRAERHGDALAGPGAGTGNPGAALTALADQGDAG